MSMIFIRKTTDPMHNVFAFVPGEKINIQVKFVQIPYRYRLQVLDRRKNTRLNRYGKGSEAGIEIDWPIPRTIREEHLGPWQVQIKTDTGISGQTFYVEHKERIEPPLLHAGPSILELLEPGVIPVALEEPAPIIEEVIAEKVAETVTPVTIVKGIGKTYAERLTKISVTTVSDFWNYSDRVHLAEIMRVTDNKLSRMLHEAEILLNKEMERPIIPSSEQVAVITNDLQSIRGVGPKTVEKLATLGIKSKSDLAAYKDVDTLRKTLRMSVERLVKLLSSAGKVDAPSLIAEPEIIDPRSQSVTQVKGIGVKTAQQLNSAGVATIGDLINSNVDDLVQRTNFSKKRLNFWQLQAKKLIR
ncbi:MAG: helix-hairpin-helix domain-containing protein [Candidatus Heimdallarchaeota archaeon]|nr:MAG: helix-hairpin-helix domain-containing protein [Candidatus Heimdallarchaeota archaeon]